MFYSNRDRRGLPYNIIIVACVTDASRAYRTHGGGDDDNNNIILSSLRGMGRGGGGEEKK